mgnify:CR=1 FL=1
MLHPQAQALLRLIEEKGVPPTHTLTPAQARTWYRERRTFTQPDPPDVNTLLAHRPDRTQRRPPVGGLLQIVAVGAVVATLAASWYIDVANELAAEPITNMAMAARKNVLRP